MPAASIRLPQAVRRSILRQARSAQPLECCGLLVGRRSHVLFAWPVRNLAASAVRYEVDPRAHIDLRRVLRRFTPELAIIGVYHSHPRGLAVPSAADVSEALYEDWIHLIVGLGGARAEVAAFRVRRGRVQRLRLQPGGALGR